MTIPTRTLPHPFTPPQRPHPPGHPPSPAHGRGAEGEGPLIACIGPITAQTARELGLQVDVVAEEHTVQGLVRAMREGTKDEP